MKRFALILISLLLLLPAWTAAETAELPTGAVRCTVTAPDEVMPYISNLYDSDPYTKVTLHTGEVLSIQLDGAAPELLYFEFYELQKPFSLYFMNAEGIAVRRQDFKPTSYHLLQPIDTTGIVELRIVPTLGDLVLSELFPCDASFVPPFPETDAHADVLVALDRPSAELEALGGLLAQLAGEHGLSVQVVYFAQTPGFESHQCMDALRAMGVTREPVFGFLRVPDRVASLNAAHNLFGDFNYEIGRYAQMIRKLTPDLIVTFSDDKNADNLFRTAVGELIINAAATAANPKKIPELPVHTVQKVYGLSGSGATTITFDTPLYTYDGETAYALASRLYFDCYTEYRVFRREIPHSITLALKQSAVGEDAKKNDLLEHLSTASFKDYREPTPSPSPTPTPTPTPEPTEVPTQAPTAVPTEAPALSVTDEEKATPTPAPQTVTRTTGSKWLAYLPAGIGVVLAAVLLLIPKNRKLKLLALLPLALGIALTVLAVLNVLPIGQTQEEVPVVEAPTPEPTQAPTQAPTQVPTEAPTEVPTAQPTEEPTPEPTEEPTPTPDPNDAYFLDGDGEEFELDFENGHWWYKNRVLAIDIHEVHTTYLDLGPLVYYVADIRMREYSSYRSGVKSAYYAPFRFARMDGAVLAVTGDCLDNEANEKGCLIRKGIFYKNFNHADVLVIDPDNMSMHVLSAEEAIPRVLMDNGVRDTYSFAPILVKDGQISETVSRSRVDHVNPRAGIGMIEPGHWVAIITDGRQPGYSMSISLSFFAQMFIDYECTVAFNMDGGASAGIVFMGEMLNRHLAPGTSDTQRMWLDAIEFGYTTQLPPPEQSTVHNGYHY